MIKIYELGAYANNEVRTEVADGRAVLDFIGAEMKDIGTDFYRIYSDEGKVYFDLGPITYFITDISYYDIVKMLD